MSNVRATIEAKAPLAEVTAAIAAANQQITVLEALLTHAELSPSVAFIAASSILLREGFEAVLLIMALLGVIRASGSKRAALWVHGGWISALGVGFIAWLFSGYLLKISGAQREMMEAVTSLIAVVVLLIVGFWLHSRTEIGRWNRFLRIKVRAAVQNRSFLGLAGIAFIAVFREAFETVLFLRTIWIDSGEQARSALGLGVMLTLTLIILGSWALLRYSTRIPVRTLFAFSAIVMALLAVILTGKGLHALQETGALTVTTALVPLRIETLGLFPTYETLVPQLLVLLLIIGLWHFGRRPMSPRASGGAQTASPA
jgi:high-affinity iron transporter